MPATLKKIKVVSAVKNPDAIRPKQMQNEAETEAARERAEKKKAEIVNYV